MSVGQYVRSEKQKKEMGERARKAIGKLNPHWKGGLHHRKDGYELVRIGVVPASYKGARYKLKHRIIMEEFLKRPLLKSEIVHHKNGDMSDNRIENLEVMTQSEHIARHRKLLLLARKDLREETRQKLSTPF